MTEPPSREPVQPAAQFSVCNRPTSSEICHSPGASFRAIPAWLNGFTVPRPYPFALRVIKQVGSASDMTEAQAQPGLFKAVNGDCSDAHPPSQPCRGSANADD